MNYSLPSYFLVFLPLTALVYQLTPQRKRWMVLLLASWLFFWSISGKLLLYLIVSSSSIHHFGLWMDCVMEECREAVKGLPRSARKVVKARYQSRLFHIVVMGVGAQLGVLLVLKYLPFVLSSANALTALLHLPLRLKVPAFVLPIGLSFYTMQAMSYLLDVYRGTVKADRSLARLAVYMSFFPALMEGPICRYTETARQLWEGRRITWHSLTFGIQRMLYGFFKKFLVADRLNLLVKTVFDGYAQMDGGLIALGMLCYTCQLYMEFSGVMDMVIGTAEIFGVTLPENFRQPFFSRTVSEFWHRWHITLGAWFRDYVFYPVSLTESMKYLSKFGRKRLGNRFGPLLASGAALFCVWFFNGLWHGAAWHYLFFGMYHFVVILLEQIAQPLFAPLFSRTHLNGWSRVQHALQLLRTFLLVNLGELFFRANSLRDGLSMAHGLFTRFTLRSLWNGSFLNLGLDACDYTVCLLSIAAVLGVSVLHERGVSLREELARWRTVPRWAAYWAVLLVTILFGAYGMNYAPVDPIYAKF